MKNLLTLCTLGYGLLLSPYVLADQTLGRLFFTPEQRQQFEFGKFQERDGSVSDSLTINGVVQKTGGNRVAWINGVPQKIGKSDERNPQSLPLTVPNQAQPINIKVGQTINISSTSNRKH